MKGVDKVAALDLKLGRFYEKGDKLKTDSVNNIFKTVDAISFCTTKDEVEAIFQEYSVADSKMKLDVLQRVMGVTEVYNTPLENELTPEDEYLYELEIFLDGSWRLLAL